MTEILLPPQPHSPLGPSSSKRWINCPGSVLATKGLPDGDSFYAAEGTAAHALSEWVRKQFRPAATWIGSIIIVGEHKIPIDQEMAENVEMFCDYVADLKGVPLIESLVKYDRWVPEGFGTADHITLSEYADVVDFKYGKGVQVFAANNEQMMTYALGVYEEWNWLYDFKSFRLHIVQPRLDHIDSWDISVKDLLAWAGKVLAPAARRTKDPNASFKAGDWCQFCKIKATCKVRAEMVFDTVVGELTDLDAEHPRQVANMTNEEVARALTQIDNITKWCSDLKAHAMKELYEKRAVGDWKIVAGRSNRGWAKPDDEVALSLAALGLEKEMIYQPVKLQTPSKVETALGKRKKLISDLIVKPVGKPTLAPGDDRREPLVLDAAADLKDLDPDEG